MNRRAFRTGQFRPRVGRFPPIVAAVEGRWADFSEIIHSIGESYIARITSILSRPFPTLKICISYPADAIKEMAAIRYNNVYIQTTDTRPHLDAPNGVMRGAHLSGEIGPPTC